MGRRNWIWIAVGLAALGLTSALCAQAGMGRRGGRGGGPGWPSSREEMVARILDRAELEGEERAAAEAALTAKHEARRALITQREKLHAAAFSAEGTEEQLKAAMAEYRESMGEYRHAIEKEDRGLLAKLSAASQARCLALGILDNALGRSMPRRRRPDRPGWPGATDG